jgi:Cupredoxin-like domain
MRFPAVPPRLLAALLVPLLAGAPAALAGDIPLFTLTIKDHKFTPAELEIPKNTKVKLTVKNLDPTVAEFESDDLHREKIVSGGREITVFVGPLTPGRYEFYDDFHNKTTRGVLIVKP